MSNDIKTVDYETHVARADKETGQLAAEANAKYYQAEILAHASASILADAGRDLLEVKSRLKHGEFEKWQEDNLQFSKSKASKMMQLAERITDENSIFSNSETFTDLSISRVWALLAAPEEVAAEVIHEEDVSELTVRELKEKLKAAEDALASKEEPDTKKLQKEIVKLETDLLKAKDATKKAKDQLAKIEEKKNEDIGKAVADREAEIRKEADKAAAGRIEELEKGIAQAEAKVVDAERKAKAASSENFTEFRIQSRLVQSAFTECLEAIDRESEVNAELSAKMAKALGEIVRKLQEQL